MAQNSNSADRKLLTPKDLFHVVCPVCHAAICLDGESILCTGCARRYPIVDGLPILLAERAL
jgi:uncharacterized protein YbaR (Trm112 family)